MMAAPPERFRCYARSLGLAVAGWVALVSALTSSVAQPRNEAPAVGHAPRYPANRLARETSPYLLLHAHNPVQWYPWGPEALEKAKHEKKLIFLSIGYSSCYWCHVMERESFMDDEIAAYLNEHFVCIKVDREERPDIDEIYMTSLRMYYQLLGARDAGGWPLSMFLTPDARPLGGGTYFPPRSKGQLFDTLQLLGGVAQLPQPRMDGFLDVIGRVQSVWKENAERVETAADQLTGAVRAQLRGRAAPLPMELNQERLTELLAALAEDFDPEHGGFSYSPQNPQLPKFPEPSNLLFLLNQLDRQPRDAQDQSLAAARKMLLTTLDRLAAGGIRDHLGGGFHRYSVDRFWRVPHFEKMLYDNAQLATVYSLAYQRTGEERYRRVVEDLLAFVARELTSKEGAFYSALDAETDAEEGRFYVWRREELAPLAKLPGYDLFAQVYGLKRDPNFEHSYVLEEVTATAEVARQAKLSPSDLTQQLEPVRKRMLELRSQRTRPLLDNKILASWNGMMIRGYADAGRILKNEQYLAAARRAAEFVLKEMRTPDGRLLRTHTAGEAKLNAYLDDYAEVTSGLLALYEATDERPWLDAAADLTQKQIELFWDEAAGGFFYTSADHETLIVRSRGPVDGATPSGNSVAAENLLTLAELLNKPEYRTKAEATIQAFSPIYRAAPQALPRMGVAITRMVQQARP